MNWSKAKTGRGRGASFGGAVDYVMHGKNGQTSERVGMREFANLFANDPKGIAREMQATVDSSLDLKQRYNAPASGRKNERPVYAFTLSWHPDDKPKSGEMMDKAREALKVLGLQQHQSVIVEHKDTPHKHVHVIVNLVHPETGKTAKLLKDERKLDRICHDYEVSRKKLRSVKRASRLDFRSINAPPSAREKAARIKEATNRSADNMKQAHVEARQVRAQEKQELYDKYRDQKQKVYDKYQPFIDAVWRKQPSNPSLDLKPNASWFALATSVWKAVAEAIQQRKSRPLRRVFKDALDRVQPFGHESTVKDMFRFARERRPNIPIGRANDPHLTARSGPNRKARSDELKRDRNNELNALTQQYATDKAAMEVRHKEAVSVERQGWADFKAVRDRLWENWRKEFGIGPDKSQTAERMQAPDLWGDFQQAAKAAGQHAYQQSDEKSPTLSDSWAAVVQPPTPGLER